MKRVATILVALIALVAVAGSASAALRATQVVVNGGSLQGYLNSVGESINVLTDQQDIQRWQATVSNNSTFTIQVELAGNAASNTYGLYNASAGVPPLYQVFPGAATNGWFAVASFRTAPVRVVVNLFDASAALVGTNTYLGADRNDFGFYLQQAPGAGGLTFYTQDVRNPGGLAQMLTYAGTGINSGSWWLCFEDLDPAQGSDRDFDDAVLFLESVNPTPVNKTTWGSLKARFH
jgi:hypothetical protein